MWFEENRNPWLDLYSPDLVLEIAGLIRLEDERSIVCLAIDLAQAAELFIDIAHNMELGLTPKEKQDWLTNYIATPATQLLDGLQRANLRHYVDNYPNHEVDFIDSQKSIAFVVELQTVKKSRRLKISRGNAKPIPELGTLRTRLLRDLQALLLWLEVKDMKVKPTGKIQGRGPEMRGKKLKTLYREDLVFSLLKIYVKYRPSKKPSRNTTGERPQGATSIIMSEFAQFVRMSAMPILGRMENLDDQISVAIRQFKKLKKEGTFSTSIFSA
jgi:hypothetical protein